MPTSEKPCIDVRELFAKPEAAETEEAWEPRRPLPPGRTVDQLTRWERYYYGRIDYPQDAADYELYCRWFRLVRKKEDCEKLGDECPDGFDKQLAYGEAIVWERMATALLRAHVRATDPREQEKIRLEAAEEAAREHALREKERAWQEKIYERLKDCI